jgi:hypothetical protein
VNPEAMMQGFMSMMLTEAEVQQLEQQLEVNPSDVDARTKLLGYYGCRLRAKPNAASFKKHVLWMIANCPGNDAFSLISTQMTAANQGVDADWSDIDQAWRLKVNECKDNAKVLGNAGQFFTRIDERFAHELLARAWELSPTESIYKSLLMTNAVCGAADPAKQEVLQKELKTAVFQLFRSRFERSEFDYSAYLSLDGLSLAALDAGQFEDAEKYAKLLIGTAANYQNDWNFGNALHNGNNILGRIALEKGNAKDAANFLRAAGKTTGSPQLDSFGPSFTLAEELLKAGERSAVIEYLRDCSRFWMNKKLVLRWAEEVERGQTPNWFERFFTMPESMGSELPEFADIFKSMQNFGKLMKPVD